MASEEREELADRFRYHAPSEDGKAKHALLSVVMTDAADTVTACCPNGREKSLALTKLEEAKMWASAAVARNPETR